MSEIDTSVYGVSQNQPSDEVSLVADRPFSGSEQASCNTGVLEAVLEALWHKDYDEVRNKNSS